MRMSAIVLPAAVVLAIPLLLLSQAAMPRMVSVEPDTGKVGDVLTVSGENLDKSRVGEVYLTDGRNDLKVSIVEQANTAIKFKIPDAAKPGKFALMVLTVEQSPKLIEQPVRVTVE